MGVTCSGEEARVALTTLARMLDADGYVLDVTVEAGKVELRIEAGRDACAECLVPKDLLASMVVERLRDAAIDVRPTDVSLHYPETGSSTEVGAHMNEPVSSDEPDAESLATLEPELMAYTNAGVPASNREEPSDESHHAHPDAVDDPRADADSRSLSDLEPELLAYPNAGVHDPDPST
jgi:hypothetical protein